MLASTADTARTAALSSRQLVAQLLVLAIGLLLIALGAFRLTHPDSLANGVTAFQQDAVCPPAAPPTADCYHVVPAQVTSVIEQYSHARSGGDYQYWVDLTLSGNSQRVHIPACDCRLTSFQTGDQVPVYFWHGRIASVGAPGGHVLSTDENPAVQERARVIWDWLTIGGGVLLCVIVLAPRRHRRYAFCVVR